jgi:hypothetical protein
LDAAVKHFTILLCVILTLCGTSVAQWIKIVPSPTVELRDARAISLSKEGLLYIADTGHNRVIAVDSTGALVAETGGLGTTHGQFKWPQDVKADFGNTVWVVDYGNRRIEKFSRSLTYQGTLEITQSGDDAKHQPEQIAFSPHGDLYVYDRDGGRLICYDPLFNIRAEYGANTGAAFISDVAAMTFVPGLGILWKARGKNELHRHDALLNPVSTLRLSDSLDISALAPSDTCLLMTAGQSILQTCWSSSNLSPLFSEKDLLQAGVNHPDGIACSSGVIYVLDSKAGAVFRTKVSQK